MPVGFAWAQTNEKPKRRIINQFSSVGVEENVKMNIDRFYFRLYSATGLFPGVNFVYFYPGFGWASLLNNVNENSRCTIVHITQASRCYLSVISHFPTHMCAYKIEYSTWFIDKALQKTKVCLRFTGKICRTALDRHKSIHFPKRFFSFYMQIPGLLCYFYYRRSYFHKNKHRMKRKLRSKAGEFHFHKSMCT